MTNVHHCPHCELIFRNKTELEYHIGDEHAPPVEFAVEPQPPPGEAETGGPSAL